jgi:hypothetical protein
VLENVALHERPHEDVCPFCHDALRPEQETWPCDKCGTRLHAECFHDNKLACTVLACSGRAKTPEGFAPHAHPRFSEESRALREQKRLEARRRREQEQPRLQLHDPNGRPQTWGELLRFVAMLGLGGVLAPLAVWGVWVIEERNLGWVFACGLLALTAALAVAVSLASPRR